MRRSSINQRARRILSSKGEILKDSLDSSVASMWNFAQRQYSNGQLISKVQGFNAYSSAKTEVIAMCGMTKIHDAVLVTIDPLFFISLKTSLY